MKYIKNNRGEFTPFTVCLILVLNILLALLMLWLSFQINCSNVRNAVKNELTNVSIRISSDTYKAMREGNLSEYYRRLSGNVEYEAELEDMVKTNIAASIPLENDNYSVSNIDLKFRQNSDSIEYIITCDVEYYIALFGDRRTISAEDIELTGRYNLKSY